MGLDLEMETKYCSKRETTTGGGCLYIKKLTDVDQNVLETLVLASVAAKPARHPN